MTTGGHRSVPHTADLRIEAWGRSRQECLEQAVFGLVDSFADLEHAPPPRRIARCHLARATDEDTLVALLDEVIYRMDADDELPVTVSTRPAGDAGLDVTFGLVPLQAVEFTGAVPKAVSLEEIRCSADADGEWSCAATVDV